LYPFCGTLYSVDTDIALPTLTLVLGPPRESKKQLAPGEVHAVHIWECGCRAIESALERCEVVWCPRHESLGVRRGWGKSLQ